jgi:alkylhydroperoxidase family enzyme
MTHPYGFVPGFDAALEGAGPALVAHANLSRALEESSLTRRNRAQIALAVVQSCDRDLCPWAHDRAARRAVLSDEDIALARDGTALDPREAEIATLAARVSRSGAIDFSAENFAGIGLSQDEVHDVLAQVALTLIENYLLGCVAPIPSALGSSPHWARPRFLP